MGCVPALSPVCMHVLIKEAVSMCSSVFHLKVKSTQVWNVSHLPEWRHPSPQSYPAPSTSPTALLHGSLQRLVSKMLCFSALVSGLTMAWNTCLLHLFDENLFVRPLGFRHHPSYNAPLASPRVRFSALSPQWFLSALRLYLCVGQWYIHCLSL